MYGDEETTEADVSGYDRPMLAAREPVRWTIDEDAAPGLFYIGTNGQLYRPDRDEQWAHEQMPPRERAILMALLQHTTQKITRGIPGVH